MTALLEVKNHIIQSVLSEFLRYCRMLIARNIQQASPSVQTSISHTFCDFDQVVYILEANKKESKVAVAISISAPCLEQLGSLFAVVEEMKRFYPEASEITLDSALLLKFTLPFDDCSDQLVEKLSLVKRNLFSIPFYHAIALQESGCSSDEKTVMFAYRSDECVFIKPYADRVVVIFQVQFKDQVDTILSKVFIQEFVDSRKQPQLQNTPQIIYSRTIPAELEGLSIPSVSQKHSNDHSGFISVVLFPRHYAPGNRREHAVSMIQTFRNYFHYHIKTLKTSLHTRQRARTAEFLQVLNRAKPEQTYKKLTTIKGKTFIKDK